MCICINCKFYQSCWIKKGLTQIPKNFFKTSLILTARNLNTQSFFSTTFKESIDLKIQLNKFCSKNKFEFDVIQCEGFCESPGNWLN